MEAEKPSAIKHVYPDKQEICKVLLRFLVLQAGRLVGVMRGRAENWLLHLTSFFSLSLPVIIVKANIRGHDELGKFRLVWIFSLLFKDW